MIYIYIYIYIYYVVNIVCLIIILKRLNMMKEVY
jgi:hypothetical protein